MFFNVPHALVWICQSWYVKGDIEDALVGPSSGLRVRRQVSVSFASGERGEGASAASLRAVGFAGALLDTAELHLAFRSARSAGATSERLRPAFRA